MVIRDCVCMLIGGRPNCPICGGTGGAPPTKDELVQMRQDAERIMRGNATPEELRATFKIVDKPTSS